jgi:hypothetical protein
MLGAETTAALGSGLGGLGTTLPYAGGAKSAALSPAFMAGLNMGNQLFQQEAKNRQAALGGAPRPMMRQPGQPQEADMFAKSSPYSMAVRRKLGTGLLGGY